VGGAIPRDPDFFPIDDPKATARARPRVTNGRSPRMSESNNAKRPKSLPRTGGAGYGVARHQKVANLPVTARRLLSVQPADSRNPAPKRPGAALDSTASPRRGPGTPAARGWRPDDRRGVGALRPRTDVRRVRRTLHRSPGRGGRISLRRSGHSPPRRDAGIIPLAGVERWRPATPDVLPSHSFGTEVQI
jgi:hypothetical protein